MFDALLLDDFIDAATCERVLREVQSAAGSPAGIYGVRAGVDTNVRSAQMLEVGLGIREMIARRFADLCPRLEQRFGVSLSTCEDPRFLRYRSGDFFVAHQDGNTPLIRDDSLQRRVSVVLFLNETYSGGSLVFHGPYPEIERRHVVPAAPGRLVAFRSEMTHEVMPVTEGERYTVVTWYR